MWRRLLDKNSTAGDLLHRVGQTLAARVVLLAMSVVSGVVIARALGPGGRGEYALASAVAAIAAQFAMLGMHASNTYHLARDRSRLPRLLGNSLAVSWLAGGVIGAGVLLVLGVRDDLVPLQGGLLWLTALAVPLYASFTLLQNLFLGLYDTARFNAVEVVMQAASLAAVVLLVAMGWESPFSVYGVSLLVAALVIAAMVRRLARQGGGMTLSLALFRDNFRFSFRAYLSTLIFLLVARVDLLLIGNLMGSSAAGHYAVALSLGDMLAMLPVVTGNILFPRLSGEQDARTRWRIASRSAVVIGVLVSAGGALSLPLAAPLLGLMYGEQYLPAASAYVWLVPGVICLSVNTILMNYFAAEGMPPIVVAAPLVALLAKSVLGLLLIPVHGTEGAAIAASISYALVLIASGMYLWWWHRPSLALSSE